MRRTLVGIILVAAVGFATAVPGSAAAPERSTYHCTQTLATNIDPPGFRSTGVDDQVVHVTQHGVASFSCPGLGAGTTEIWLHGNLNPQLKGMLQGVDVVSFTGVTGGFDVAFQAHGGLVLVPTPPFMVLTWTADPVVGHGFGAFEGWQLRGKEQRDLRGITWDLVLFEPGS